MKSNDNKELVSSSSIAKLPVIEPVKASTEKGKIVEILDDVDNSKEYAVVIKGKNYISNK